MYRRDSGDLPVNERIDDDDEEEEEDDEEEQGLVGGACYLDNSDNDTQEG